MLSTFLTAFSPVCVEPADAQGIVAALGSDPVTPSICLRPRLLGHLHDDYPAAGAECDHPSD